MGDREDAGRGGLGGGAEGVKQSLNRVSSGRGPKPKERKRARLHKWTGEPRGGRKKWRAGRVKTNRVATEGGGVLPSIESWDTFKL